MKVKVKFFVPLLIVLVLLTFTPLSKAAPSNNPVFATISAVQQMISNALISVNDKLTNHEERITDLESKVADLEDKVNGLLITPTLTPFDFFDDFNDGNTNGWKFIGSQKIRSDLGNWRIENGALINDAGGDGYIALVDNLNLSSQTIETKIYLIGPAGYGGNVIWFQDYDNQVSVSIYPGAGSIGIGQSENGVSTNTNYPSSINYNDGLWYDLKVKANSINGDLDVFINGVKSFTHHTTISKLNGQTGLMNGNSGSYFDDFELTSN